jgi:methanogenic corrinoid protein MtbC1
LNFVHEGITDILDAIAPESQSGEETGLRVCCIPARANRDQLAGEMLAQVLRQNGHTAQCTGVQMPLGELLAQVKNMKSNAVCISAVAPTTLIHARYLCAKLRAHAADLTIMVGLWGRAGLTPEMMESMRASGADEIVTTLAEAINRVTILDNPNKE